MDTLESTGFELDQTHLFTIQALIEGMPDLEKTQELAEFHDDILNAASIDDLPPSVRSAILPIFRQIGH